jgi:hypothetical protein
MNTQPDLGSLVKPLIGTMTTKATTALGAFLLASVPTGVLSSDQAAQIAGSVVGLGLLIGSVAWSWIKVKLDAKKLVAAAATGDPKADPSALSSHAAVAAAIADPRSPITAKA